MNVRGVKQVTRENTRQQPRGERRCHFPAVDLEHYVGVTGLRQLPTLVPEEDILRLGMCRERPIINGPACRFVTQELISAVDRFSGERNDNWRARFDILVLQRNSSVYRKLKEDLPRLTRQLLCIVREPLSNRSHVQSKVKAGSRALYPLQVVLQQIIAAWGFPKERFVELEFVSHCSMRSNASLFTFLSQRTTPFPGESVETFDLSLTT